MNIKRRRHSLLVDFQKVYDFLEDNYVYPRWWLTPQYWEYAHYHPQFNHRLAHRMGIWEDGGKIVGVALYEMDLGAGNFVIKAGYEFLKQEILEYAEKELAKAENEKHIFETYSYASDEEDKFYLSNGYERANTEPIVIYAYEKDFVQRKLPDGFSIMSLDDEVDELKIKRCLWKGFDHGNEIEDEDIDGNIHAGTAPHFRSDLTTIIKAPNGEYACFAGMWVDAKNKYAYLEPLATVPEYRRMGLATIAFMEAMRKTVPFGAKYCYSGTREFYHSIGCETVGYVHNWRKEW